MRVMLKLFQHLLCMDSGSEAGMTELVIKMPASWFSRLWAFIFYGKS